MIEIVFLDCFGAAVGSKVIQMLLWNSVEGKKGLKSNNHIMTTFEVFEKLSPLNIVLPYFYIILHKAQRTQLFQISSRRERLPLANIVGQVALAIVKHLSKTYIRFPTVAEPQENMAFWKTLLPN